ncbi:MAG: hypothetical protein ABR886_05035 [Dehalococcoidales bacterium]|jgi:peptidoglycan hydrolase CwlO-like protein
MNRIIKIAIVLGLSVFSLVGAVACGGGGTKTVTVTVTPTDYASTKSALADANTQISSLQQQVQTLQGQNGDLQKQMTAQSANADNLTKQIQTLNTRYQQLVNTNTQNLATISDLQTKYQALKAAQDQAAQQAAALSSDNIAAALLAAINRARADKGLAVLAQGTNLPLTAAENSLKMAQNRDIVSVYSPYQEEFIATGYSSVDSLVNAAFTIWKSNDYWYQLNILPELARFGTVQVYELDDIYYITYLASNFP